MIQPKKSSCWLAHLKSTVDILGILLAVAVLPAGLAAQTLSFPGAEGAGRYASGGRAGQVFEVTNLNDNGPGSLRAAVQATGPRTVVFRVSGTIKLLSKLDIRNDSITIAGQTAPGDGICVRDYTVRSEANNVIVRYMRFRLGDSTRYADDSFDAYGTPMKRRMIVDHCSISWAIDEDGSFYDNAEFTMQWCYITESLYHSYHPKGNHGYGGIWGGWKASFHHNLLAHNSSRNPRFNGSRYTGQPDSEMVDFRNNVIYNWGFNSAYGGEAGNQNMVANYFKYGPGTNAGVRSRIVEPSDTAGNWYIADNYVEGNPAVTADNWNGGVQGAYALVQKNKRRATPFPFDSVTTSTPQEAFDLVLLAAGASLHRDTVDARITQEVRTGTATFGGLWGAGRGIIDSQDSVGGWPALNSLPAPPDSDHDGMPDEWEIANGLNPTDPADGPVITGDGYTNLEHYINGLVPLGPTGVLEPHSGVVAAFELRPNYPNPFNPSTTIEFTIPERRRVTLEVFNILGMRATTLLDAELPPGVHRLPFDGSRLGTGVYYCRLSWGGSVKTTKMLLLK